MCIPIPTCYEPTLCRAAAFCEFGRALRSLPDELELDTGILNADGGPAAASAPEADSDSRATSLTRPRATLSFETDVGGVGYASPLRSREN